jgi:hypothetical protein
MHIAFIRVPNCEGLPNEQHARRAAADARSPLVKRPAPRATEVEFKFECPRSLGPGKSAIAFSRHTAGFDRAQRIDVELKSSGALIHERF